MWGETAGVDGQLLLLCPVLFILQVLKLTGKPKNYNEFPQRSFWDIAAAVSVDDCLVYFLWATRGGWFLHVLFSPFFWVFSLWVGGEVCLYCLIFIYIYFGCSGSQSGIRLLRMDTMIDDLNYNFLYLA